MGPIRPTVFTNQVLLEANHTHLFTYCVHFNTTMGGLSGVTSYGPQNLSYLLKVFQRESLPTPGLQNPLPFPGPLGGCVRSQQGQYSELPGLRSDQHTTARACPACPLTTAPSPG